MRRGPCIPTALIVLLLACVAQADSPAPSLSDVTTTGSCPALPVPAILTASVAEYTPETTFTLALNPESADWPSTLTAVHWASDFGAADSTMTTLDLSIPETAPETVTFTAWAEGEPPFANCTTWMSEMTSVTLSRVQPPAPLRVQFFTNTLYYGTTAVVEVKEGDQSLLLQESDLVPSELLEIDIPRGNGEIVVTYHVSGNAYDPLQVTILHGDIPIFDVEHDSFYVQRNIRLNSSPTTTTLLVGRIPARLRLRLFDEDATAGISGENFDLRGFYLPPYIPFDVWLDVDFSPGCYVMSAYARDSGGPFYDYSSGGITFEGECGTFGVGASDRCFDYCSGGNQRWPLYITYDECLFGEDAVDICPGSNYGDFELDCSHYSHCRPPTPTATPSPTPTPSCVAEPVPAVLESSVGAIPEATTFTLTLRPEADDWPSTITVVQWYTDYGYLDTTTTPTLDVAVTPPVPPSMKFLGKAVGEPQYPYCDVWESETASLILLAATPTPSPTPPSPSGWLMGAAPTASEPNAISMRLK
ncbi:hypothetical protein KQI84_14715 [bacterium]|nr:hypothetical protein [bacterium]